MDLLACEILTITHCPKFKFDFGFNDFVLTGFDECLFLLLETVWGEVFLGENDDF